MEKKNYKDVIGSGLLLLFFGGFLLMSLEVNKLCRTYPQLICIIGLLLTAVNMGRAFYRLRKNKPDDVPAPMSKDQLLSCVVAVGLTVAYVALCKIVGYIVTTAIFIAGFSVYLSYRNQKWSKLWTYPVVAVATTLILYFTFKFFLNVPLPKGFLI